LKETNFTIKRNWNIFN